MPEAILPHSRIDHMPFDGTAVWGRLAPEAQARIGAAALEYAVAMVMYRHAHDPVARAAAAVEDDAREALLEAAVAVDGGVPESEWYVSEKGGGIFRIPSILARVCLVCGCSQNDACDDGCSWHSAVLCTACSGPAVPATSDGHAIVQARLIETSHRIRDARGLPRLAGEEILGRAFPLPDLAKEDARAVCKGACRAVSRSPLADVPPSPTGDGLAAIAGLIDRMHEEA